MNRFQRIWGKIRDKIDHLVGYNPNPEVVVQDGDRRIIISDSLPPEANAMALAMYSRSPRSFLEHLQEVLKKGWQKFIAQFYVGYGHQSIGDCGTTTICIEGVSMLCAKAIQQYLLYKGQEASTRYLNMLLQKIINVCGVHGQMIQERWMHLYAHLLEILVPAFKERFPMKAGENEKEYSKAINARAFDVARAFLPAGATTLVGWHTTLREASVHLLELRHHPLAEVREISEKISEALHIKYPSSGFDKRYPATEKYVDDYMRDYTYMEPKRDSAVPFASSNTFDTTSIGLFESILSTRPAKTELPTFLKKFGTAKFIFPLDFGSFRDLQRHRSGIILMPLLATTHGFHEWYIEQIPEEHLSYVFSAITEQISAINALDCTAETKQYYTAMGFKVVCECTFDLPAAVYVAELRSTQAVHPTLRVVAKQMGKELQKLFPKMAIHCDFSDDVWSTLRGKHDIVKKEI